ncbi:copper transporter 2-like [Impatiens glandulifera]|uniref:copper transporter 2-like n=1 Tax=Impatiens glandulifera TaxID=253017 RepID=UPI001FB09BF8|nr:copper transporter 2-like [Impatiens glandulifera]
MKDMSGLVLTWGSSHESLKSYALHLLWVFTLSMIVETLSHARLLNKNMNNVTAGLLQTLMYGLRTGLTYLVMLSVMSFDGFVLLVAVAGYSVGFFVFGSRLFDKYYSDINTRAYQRPPTDIPPLNC